MSATWWQIEEYIGALSQYDLLIIDDLGAERKSEFAIQNVFNVINRRWESGKPLIITTNLSLDEINTRQISPSREFMIVSMICAHRFLWVLTAREKNLLSRRKASGKIFLERR